MLVDGKSIEFDQPPIIENDRTLVPMRAIFEALGAEVDWEQDIQTATAERNNTEIRIGIGNTYIEVNGKNIEIDVPAKIMNDRTLIPVRAVSESFGCDVDWDQENRSVIISTLQDETREVYSLMNPSEGDYTLSSDYTMNSDKSVKIETNENKSKTVIYKDLDIAVGEDDILGFWVWTSRNTLRQHGDGDYRSELKVSINGGENITLMNVYNSHAGFNIKKLSKGTFTGTINTLKFTFSPNSEESKQIYLDSVELNYKEPTYIIFNFDSNGKDFYENGYSLFKNMGLAATFRYTAGAPGDVVGYSDRSEAKVHQKMIDSGFDYGIYSANGTAGEHPSDYYSDYNGWYGFAKNMFSTNSSVGVFCPSLCMSQFNKVGETYDKAMIDAGFMGIRYTTSTNYLDYFDPEYREIGTYSISGAWTADSEIVETTKKRIDHAIEYGYSAMFMSHNIKNSTAIIDSDTINTGELGLREILEYALEKQTAGECKIVSFAEYMRLEHPEIYQPWIEKREKLYADYLKKYPADNEFVESENYGNDVALFGGSFAQIPASEIARNYWAEALNFTITNYSRGGAGFSGLTGENNIQSQVDKACADDKPEYDIYILWASSNDLYKGAGNIGKYTDYTEADGFDTRKLNTQCGGINYCIKKIREKAPNAKICFFTSMKILNVGAKGYDDEYSGADGLNKFVDAQIQCCENQGILYLDQYKEVPLEALMNDELVSEDGLHMTEAGYEYIKRMQVEFLAGL